MANNQIPVFGTPGKDLLAYLREAIAEGDIWLRAQKPTQEWKGVMDMLGPMYGGTNGSGLVGQSNTGYNRARHLYSEVRATISNFQHAGEFSPTEEDAQEYFDRAHLLTNLHRDWERRTFSQLQIRDALGYALAKGTGYLYLDWDKSAISASRGDMRLRAWDPSDVTFVQMPRSHNVQQAYMVLIRETLPINLARRMYASNPTFAAALVPDGDETSWIQKGLETVQRAISPFLRTAGTGPTGEAKDGSPTVDIWHAYTLDGSVNPNPEPMKMGALGTNWTYTVPALGDPIPQGIINPDTGVEWNLSAGPDECLLFPLRRLTIFSRTGIAYDGSSPWWHGAVPLARIRFNDLPWEALGASQVGDAKTIQDGIVALMRIIEDSAAARMRPPLLFDDNRVDKSWAEAFNGGPRAGAIASADLSQGSPIAFPYDPGAFDVPSWIGGEGGFIRQQEARMDYITSAQDLVAIAKARQVPSSDTLEKLMEMAGPIVQDMVGAVVEPLTQLGEWWKAYCFQFYTRSRMYRIADPDGVELKQAVKYIPEKLMPYRTTDTAEQRQAQNRSYLEDFKYEVTESGINEINRMSRLLTYIQLSKSGVLPISKFTMAKAAKVPNWGPPPLGTNTEQERVQADWRIDLERKIEEAQAIQAAMGQVPGAAPGAPPGAPPPTPVGSEEGPGRPPSFGAPPRIVSKDGGTRSTITTSR